MRSLLLMACISFFTSLKCIAQDELYRPVNELQELVKESGNDTDRAQLLLELAMAYVVRPGAEKADMNRAIVSTNSALKLSKQLHYKRGLGRCCFVYSNICRESDDADRGMPYIKQSTDIFLKLGAPEDLADVYMETSNYINPTFGDINEKIRLQEQATTLYHQANKKLKEAGSLKSTGDLYPFKQKYEEAIAVTKRALQLYQEINYPRLQAVYDQLGMLNAQTGRYREAMKYGLLALKTAEREKDSSALLCTIYNRLGTSHFYIGQPDKAIQYYQVAMSLAISGKDTVGAMMIANNIVNAHLKANRPEAAIAFMKPLEAIYGHTKPYGDVGMYNSLLISYTRAKEYDKAKPYAEETIRSSQCYSTNDPRHFWSGVYLMEYFVGVGQYGKVISLGESMENLPPQYYNPRTMQNVYHFWHQADSALGNYKDALTHYEMSVAIGDSLNGMKVKNETSQLLIQYETEKKEKDIQLLTKQGQLQKSRLQQATFLRNATLAGIAVALFVIGLLYNRYQLKQRNNRQLELQKSEINEKNARLQHLLTEKEWLLKEIHHRIKNNLQMVMSLLSSQSAYLQNDAALTAIQDSRHRIHAMSLIHQKLYTTDNVSVIDMPVYIQELTGYMRDCFDTAHRIRFQVNITPLKLDVSQAIPLALILNEAITNSLKYAFPHASAGTIVISLKQHDLNRYRLTISDDGIGMPADIKQKSGSLGMSLMKGLSEDLDGTFDIESNDHGTLVAISFIQDLKMHQIGFMENLPAINL